MVTVLMAAFIPWHGNRTIRVLTLLMSLVSTETMFPTFATFHHPDSDESVGFFLMHDVLNVETTISLITYVKTTPPGLTDFVDRLSKTAKETQATLNRLEKDDPSLTLDHNPLPNLEQQTRKYLAAERQHQLFLETKGRNFARALLVTQIDACNYILQLAKVTAEADKDADRAQTLKKISSRWTLLRDQAVGLLERSE
jgi:hypothetical protein